MEEKWEEARTWFNCMNITTRNQMIMVMYKLCVDVSKEKIEEVLNEEWSEKFKIQVDYNRDLLLENQLLKEIHNMKTSDSLDDVLGKIPNSEITLFEGNYIFLTGGYKIHIQKNNDIEKFKQNSIKLYDKDEIDFTISTFNKKSTKALEIKLGKCKKSSLLIIHTDIQNYPERILYAIDAGIVVLIQGFSAFSTNNTNISKLNSLVCTVETLQDSIKERKNQLLTTSSLIEKDNYSVENMKEILMSTINSNTKEISTKDRIVKYCYVLMKQHGENKVSKSMLEEKCTVNGLNIRLIRDLGGIKIIKNLALQLEELDCKNNTKINKKVLEIELKSEPNSELDSDSESEI